MPSQYHQIQKFSGPLQVAFLSKSTEELDGTGVLPSFLMVFSGHHVQLGRSGNAKTFRKMPKKSILDRLTDRPTNRSTDTMTKSHVARVFHP